MEIQILSTAVIRFLFFMGLVLLQIFLCKIENNWIGLILPILTFVFSLFCVWNLAKINNISQMFKSFVSVLLIANIPTVIMLAIYFVCKKIVKKTI